MVPTGLAYRPALDGLRAVAVAAVVVYHFEPAWLPGGFLGVDTFFVLSGYLITALLLAEWGREGSIGLGTFWSRRARRLLPALFLMLAVVAVAGSRWLPATELGRLRADGLAGVFYVANWRQIFSGGSYFDLTAGPSTLRHLWSLGIEEQFYLLWPLVVLGCLRLGRGRRAVLGCVCVAGAAASALAMAATFVAADPSRSYYGTDTRAHGLLVGAGLAVVLAGRPVPERARRPLALGGAAALVLCAAAWWWASDVDPWLYHGGFLAYALATAAVVAASVAAGPSPMVGALSLAPLQYLGRISYGVYLWHWPVAVLVTPARTGVDGLGLFTLRVALTVGIAAASFALVEQPIRTGAWPVRLVRPLAPVSVAAVVAVLVLATAGARPVPAYLATPSSEGPTLRLAAPAPAAPAAPTTVAGPAPTPPTVSTAPVPPSTTPAPPAPPPPERVMFLGDSVAFTLEPSLTAALTDRGIQSAGGTFPGCGVVTGLPVDDAGVPYPWSEACSDQIPVHQRAAVAEFQPDVVVLLSYWETSDRMVEGTTTDLTAPSGQDRLLGLHQEAIDRLTATGARVVLLLPPRPVAGEEGPPEPEQVRRVELLTDVLVRLVAANPGRVAALDLDAIVCGGGAGCPTPVDGVTLRPGDGLHFSEPGAVLVADRLAGRLTGPAWTELWSPVSLGR